jgi:predicted ATPase
MTASSPCSKTINVIAPEKGLIVLEGMPGAGKTTTADALAAAGYGVVGEYTDDRDATIPVSVHPDISDDGAHQLNWLRKSSQTEARLVRDPVVYADRDWLSALSYAYSCAVADGGALLAERTAWAERHLADGTLLLPGTYVVYDIDPATSLARRADRLRPGHPWNCLNALEQLRDFYRDPPQALQPFSAALAGALSRPRRLDISGRDDRGSVLAYLSSLAELA